MSDKFLANLKFTSIILFFIGGVSAFINYLGTSNGWWDSEAGIFPIILTILAGLLTITLSMIETHKMNKSLLSLKDKFDSFTENLAIDIKRDIASTVSTISDTASLIEKEERKVFLENIFYNFKNSLVNLSIGKVEENDPDKYHQFAINSFNLVQNGGLIIASSTVDPNGFWSQTEINKYLSNNKSLINDKGVTFKRYFFIPDDNQIKEDCKMPIARNINIGAEVFVIDVKKHNLENSEIYCDAGRIDNTMTIKSTLHNGQIRKVKGYFRNNSEYKNLTDIINQWEGIAESPIKYYGMSEKEFIDLL